MGRGRKAVWLGPQVQRATSSKDIYMYFTKNFKFINKDLKNLMTVDRCLHCPVSKVTLLPIFPLSFSSSLSKINTVLLSTIQHF
jgi:hypothetical protein